MPLPLAGAVIKAADLAAIFPQGVDAWVSYTPVWGSTGTQPAIGNGSISGAWTKIGRTVHYTITMTVGSTSTFGTAVYTWSLPVAGASSSRPAGAAWIVDTSTGTQVMRNLRQNSTTVVYGISEAGAFVGPTIPMTWANGDIIIIAGSYEAAS